MARARIAKEGFITEDQRAREGPGGPCHPSAVPRLMLFQRQTRTCVNVFARRSMFGGTPSTAFWRRAAFFLEGDERDEGWMAVRAARACAALGGVSITP